MLYALIYVMEKRENKLNVDINEKKSSLISRPYCKIHLITCSYHTLPQGSHITTCLFKQTFDKQEALNVARKL